MPRKHLTHDISIHALREEGDVEIIIPQIVQKEFLSTPSARRATCGGLAFAAINDKISIHALREEGDPSRAAIPPDSAPISIHALREEGDVSGPVLVSTS